MSINKMIRSLMFVPASDERKCRKALKTECDGIIFDLEDAVSPDKKAEAREFLCSFLKEVIPSDKEIIVRINTLDSEWGFKDIEAVVPSGPDALLIPKAETNSVIAGDVFAQHVEAQNFLDKKVGFILLIETISAVDNIDSLIKSSDRICAILLGAEDYTKELNVKRTPGGEEIAYVRNKLVVTARANNIDIIDTPFTDFRNEEGLEKDLEYIKSIGITAKAAIHPAQIKLINNAFTPTEEEIAYAREVLKAFEEAAKEGRGACSLNGAMIDAPIMERARQILLKTGNSD